MSDLYQFPKAVWAIHSLLLLAFAATVHADLRTSTDYTVAADTTDAGGQHLPLSLRVNSSKFCILFVSDF